MIEHFSVKLDIYSDYAETISSTWISIHVSQFVS